LCFYSHHGDSVVKIFPDKIEFFNPGRLPDSIQEEDLLKGRYVSDCRNKLISKIFKEINWIEKYGTGISRITELFLNYGLTAPTFENFQHGFKVTAFAKKIDGNIISTNVGIHTNVTENDEGTNDVTVNNERANNVTENVTVNYERANNVTENVTENDERTNNVTENRLELILKEIKNNPTISFDELSEQLHVVRMTIYRDIEKLKRKGLIIRVGPDKGGHWEVKKD